MLGPTFSFIFRLWQNIGTLLNMRSTGCQHCAGNYFNALLPFFMVAASTLKIQDTHTHNSGKATFAANKLLQTSRPKPHQDSGLFSASSADFASSLQVFGGCMSAVIAMEYILKACNAYISSHSTLASHRLNNDCFFQNRRYSDSENSPAFASM